MILLENHCIILTVLFFQYDSRKQVCKNLILTCLFLWIYTFFGLKKTFLCIVCLIYILLCNFYTNGYLDSTIDWSKISKSCHERITLVNAGIKSSHERITRVNAEIKSSAWYVGCQNIMQNEQKVSCNEGFMIIYIYIC